MNALTCKADEQEDFAGANAEAAREFEVNEFTTPGKQNRRQPVTLDPKRV